MKLEFGYLKNETELGFKICPLF